MHIFINEHTETLYNMYQIYSTKFSEMFIRCLLYENKHWQLPFGKHEAGIKGSLRKPLLCPLFSPGGQQWLADLVPS